MLSVSTCLYTIFQCAEASGYLPIVGTPLLGVPTTLSNDPYDLILPFSEPKVGFLKGISVGVTCLVPLTGEEQFAGCLPCLM